MSENPKPPPSDADAALEREIRSERKFSAIEALGRMAGPGMMKGVSPVAPKRQAEAAIESYLSLHLPDTGGVLRGVLLRCVGESELLLSNYDKPLVALAGYISGVLGSEYLLKELVREADVEWGRVLGERPHFQKQGCEPDPDDPYTAESVRNTLSRLQEQLAGEK